MRRFVRMVLFMTASLLSLAAGACIRLLYALVGARPETLLAHLTRLWAQVMLRIVGMTVITKGAPPRSVIPGSLLVANHQSYLDIIVIASLVPTLFVAKSDVRKWPLLGWLASLGGTLFIDRNSFRNGHGIAGSMERLLRDKISLQLFPEGTSTDGSQVLPFRPLLFTAAFRTGSSVAPLTINYRMIGGQTVSRQNRDTVCWYGSMTFVDHFLPLLDTPSITVAVTVHPPILSDSSTDPKDLASWAWLKVSSAHKAIV